MMASFVIGNGSIGTHLMNIGSHNSHAINPRRRVLLIILYMVSTMALTAGESMLQGFDHTMSDSSILLSNQ
jgi:hypothetical protein